MKDLTKLQPWDYLKIIPRRRWYVVVTFIIVCIGTGIYAWFKPDVYRSVSRIQVQPASVSQDYVKPSVRSTPEEQIAAIRGTIQSRSFLERMIQDFQLFGYGMGDDFSMEEAVRAVSNNIQITTFSNDTFNLAFHASNPQLAQSFTRRMAETLIQTSSSARKNRAIETDQFLEDQVRQISEKIAVQEEKIKQFKMAHFGRLPDQFDANMSALNRLDIQLASVENALQQLKDKQKLMENMARNQQQMLQLTQNMISSNAIVMSEGGDSVTNPVLAAKERELEALTAKYTPQYPDVVRLKKEIEHLKKKMEQAAAQSSNTMEANAGKNDAMNAPPVEADPLVGALPNAEDIEMESAKRDIKRREKERESILGQIRATQARLNLAPALEQELTALNREYGSLNQQYENLQNKKFQSQMTTNLETNRSSDTYKIIDDANLPEQPIFPNRLQIIGIGLLAGLVVGVGAAIGRELLDTTLGGEDEVTALLQIPVLATISEMPARQLKKVKRNVGLLKSA